MSDAGQAGPSELSEPDGPSPLIADLTGYDRRTGQFGYTIFTTDRRTIVRRRRNGEALGPPSATDPVESLVTDDSEPLKALHGLTAFLWTTAFVENRSRSGYDLHINARRLLARKLDALVRQLAQEGGAVREAADAVKARDDAIAERNAAVAAQALAERERDGLRVAHGGASAGQLKARTDLNQALQRIAQIETDLEQTRRERDELAARTAEWDTLQANVERLTREQDTLRDEYNALVEDRDALRVENDALNAFVTEWTEAPDVARIENEDLRAEIAALRAERDHLGIELDGARNQSQGLQGSVNALTAERDALVGERDVLRTENGTLQANVAELTAQSDALTGERDTLRAENEDLRTDNAGLTVERNVLRTENDDLRNNVVELTAERDASRTENEALHANVAELTAERDDLRTRNEGLLDNVANLTATLTTIQTNAEGLTLERDALNSERDTLRNEIEGLRAANETLVTNHAEADPAGLTERLAALENTKAALETEVVDLTEERDELKSENDALRANDQVLRGDLANANSAVAELTRDREQLRNENNELRQIHDLEDEGISSLNVPQGIIRELCLLRDKNRDNLMIIANIRQENSRLRQFFDRIRFQVNQVTANISRALVPQPTVAALGNEYFTTNLENSVTALQAAIGTLNIVEHPADAA